MLCCTPGLGMACVHRCLKGLEKLVLRQRLGRHHGGNLAADGGRESQRFSVMEQNEGGGDAPGKQIQDQVLRIPEIHIGRHDDKVG